MLPKCNWGCILVCLTVCVVHFLMQYSSAVSYFCPALHNAVFNNDQGNCVNDNVIVGVDVCGNPSISITACAFCIELALISSPCYGNWRVEIDTKLPIVGDQKWVIWICSFNVPMAPGKTRSIVCSARNFFQFTMPGPAWWQVTSLSIAEV